MIVMLADILLSANIAFTKRYQDKAGVAVVSSLYFNVFSGLTTFLFFWILNGFKISFSVFRIISVIMIMVAIILSNRGEFISTKKILFLCMLVFISNGFVSIFSKYHQINTMFYKVSSNEFIMTYGLMKCVLSFVAYIIVKKKQNING